MAATFTLFTAPAAFFGAIASPPASTSPAALRYFGGPHVTSRDEDVSDIVADDDRTTTNDIPVIIVSSATLTSIQESPAVSAPAPSSPRSSIISAFTTSSATSSSPSSSTRTSLTTSLRKALSRLSLRSSSPSASRKPSMADDMDMDFCCRGPPKKIYEDLDMDFCCRGEDFYEDEDEDEDDYPITLEDPVDGSIDTSAADSPAAPPHTTSSPNLSSGTRSSLTSSRLLPRASRSRHPWSLHLARPHCRTSRRSLARLSRRRALRSPPLP